MEGFGSGFAGIVAQFLRPDGMIGICDHLAQSCFEEDGRRFGLRRLSLYLVYGVGKGWGEGGGAVLTARAALYLCLYRQRVVEPSRTRTRRAALAHNVDSCCSVLTRIQMAALVLTLERTAHFAECLIMLQGAAEAESLHRDGGLLFVALAARLDTDSATLRNRVFDRQRLRFNIGVLQNMSLEKTS